MAITTIMCVYSRHILWSYDTERVTKSQGLLYSRLLTFILDFFLFILFLKANSSVAQAERNLHCWTSWYQMGGSCDFLGLNIKNSKSFVVLDPINMDFNRTSKNVLYTQTSKTRASIQLGQFQFFALIFQETCLTIIIESESMYLQYFLKFNYHSTNVFENEPKNPTYHK